MYERKRRIEQSRRPIRLPFIPEKRMDAAGRIQQTVWLYGATAYGKTSFIRNYFRNSEYYYFEGGSVTAERLQPLLETTFTTVVIDDMQNVKEEAVNTLIEKLALKKDLWLILSGRIKISPRFIPVHLRKIFMIISEEDLSFSEKEIRLYLNQWHIFAGERKVHKIMKLTRGCPIGVKLIVMELASGKQLTEETIQYINKMFCDYVEDHVYSDWEPEFFQFFMELSIVEEFDCSLAEMITGNRDTLSLVHRALEIGNFLEKNGERYRFRAMALHSMRNTLIHHTTAEQRKNLYYNAGLAYERRGDYPKALKMYEKCDNNERICDILVANAHKNPESGHYFELRKYYLSLPEEYIERRAELMAGMSMLQSMLMNPEESEAWYQKLKNYSALQSGRKQKEAAKWIMYLDIALPHRGTGNLAEIFKNTWQIMHQAGSCLPDFSVTSNLPSLMNGGKDFCEWSKRDTVLATRIGKMVETVLGRYGKGLVSLALAESAFEKGDDSGQVVALANRGSMQAEAGGKFELCFVALALLTRVRLFRGRAEEAQRMMEDFQGVALQNNGERMIPNIQAMQCRFALYWEDWSVIDKWMRETGNLTGPFNSMERYRYLTYARVLIAQGKNDDAMDILQRVHYYAQVIQRTFIQMETELLIAIITDRCGQTGWQKNFQKMLSQAEAYHFIRIISREGAAVLPLLEAEQWVVKDRDYFQRVLSETKTMALTYPSYLKVQSNEKNKYSLRALQILKLQAEGFSNVQIGEKLGIKESTVKYHSKNTYQKLGVTNRAAAVSEAEKQHLI